MTEQRSPVLTLDRMAAARLERRGRAAFASFSLRVLARTPSTQDVVRAAAGADAAAGFCCVAGEQTAGRGRHDRRWDAPPGTALLASILLRPTECAIPGVPIAAALAIASALAECADIDVQLKWPNDVLARGAKLAGILAELSPPGEAGADPAVILGFGINLSAGAVPPGVRGISVDDVCAEQAPPWHVLLAAILTTLAARLEQLEREGLTTLLPDWRARAAGLGSPTEVTTPMGTVCGTAVDIDGDGALLVASEGRIVRFLAGDVHIGVPPKMPEVP